MNSDAHLRNIIRLFQPEGLNRFSFNNRAYVNTPDRSGKSGNSSGNYIRLLQRAIYEQYYLRRTQESPQLELPLHGKTTTGQQSANAFAEALRKANQSKSNWSPGWKVERSVSKNTLLVSRGDEQFTISENSFREVPGSSPKAGSVFCPAEFFPAEAAFYFAFSNAPSFLQNAQIVRFYFHLLSGSAAGIVEWITSVLNKYNIPFQFKCLANPDHYGRPDSGVLYVCKKHVRVVSEWIAEDAELLLPKLQAGVPVFSLPLFEGVGFAENPLNGESFGMARALSLAAALCNLWQQQISGENSFAAVEEHLRREGYNLDQFHLNPFTQMPYTFPKNNLQ